ncbi:hypothetical protein BU25DRAFT_42999 [Macroventuria anomochaeta]|uniref:Uncharacterized protein n=1 Tax=Macroventuria anomochaeta TaxID=301207 RepID=A0ACB6S3N6_9PLEO|nr:uncharacterized protein BU25DRAFT_42999 [Macroventuria anomochaeta]KAF2628270.1 hypothetical protein BU25DRAFT_42999 [Macroventuria anomochaeta]
MSRRPDVVCKYGRPTRWRGEHREAGEGGTNPAVRHCVLSQEPRQRPWSCERMMPEGFIRIHQGLVRFAISVNIFFTLMLHTRSCRLPPSDLEYTMSSRRGWCAPPAYSNTFASENAHTPMQPALNQRILLDLAVRQGRAVSYLPSAWTVTFYGQAVKLGQSYPGGDLTALTCKPRLYRLPTCESRSKSSHEHV